MHRKYFPKCTVEGPYEPPVPFEHLGINGFIPNKCGCCDNLFEGECLRAVDVTGGYLHLDFGPCGIPGSTDAVIYEDKYITSKVSIPKKCLHCNYLLLDQSFGFTCKKDSSKWGGIHRGLDWGNWQPDIIYFELPSPKLTTEKMCRFVSEDNLIPFIKEYRRINPGVSINEAKKDFALMREKVEAQKNGGKVVIQV